MKVTPAKLIVRCYAEKAGNQWQAFCLDLDLAAQGETFKEAREKLGRMIFEYVYDALAGEDKAHADSLLNRRAPLVYWLRYYWLTLWCMVGILHLELHRLFTKSLPLTLDRPYNHAA